MVAMTSLCLTWLPLCLQATFYALQHTYGFLSPELWQETRFQKAPFQEFTDVSQMYKSCHDAAMHLRPNQCL